MALVPVLLVFLLPACGAGFSTTDVEGAAGRPAIDDAPSTTPPAVAETSLPKPPPIEGDAGAPRPPVEGDAGAPPPMAPMVEEDAGSPHPMAIDAGSPRRVATDAGPICHSSEAACSSIASCGAESVMIQPGSIEVVFLGTSSATRCNRDFGNGVELDADVSFNVLAGRCAKFTTSDPRDRGFTTSPTADKVSACLVSHGGEIVLELSEHGSPPAEVRAEAAPMGPDGVCPLSC